MLFGDKINCIWSEGFVFEALLSYLDLIFEIRDLADESHRLQS